MIGAFLIPSLTLAGPAMEGLETVAEASGLKNGKINSWQDIVVVVLNSIMMFLGFITVILIMYGGFMWTTAAGDESKVEKAKKILKNAIIGLAVILMSMAISNFVFSLMGVQTAVWGS